MHAFSCDGLRESGADHCAVVINCACSHGGFGVGGDGRAGLVMLLSVCKCESHVASALVNGPMLMILLSVCKWMSRKCLKEMIV